MSKYEEYIKKPNFCLAPWIHLHVLPNGSTQPCCMWDNYSADNKNNPNRFANINNYDNVHDLLNSEGFNDLRKTFAFTDKMELACERCYDREKNNGPSMRSWFNTTFANDASVKSVENTTADGKITDLSVQYLDIRFGNICNLKCRMCGHELSSSWYEEGNKIAELKEWQQSKEKFVHVDCYDKIEPLLGDVTEIYFAGGEPTLYPEHLMILDKLIELGNTDLSIKYNSNLTTLKYKGRNFIDVWKHFKNVNIGASIDGMNDTVEYIRTNLKWSDIVENFNTIKRDAPHVCIAPSPTIGVLNIEDFHEFEKYAIKNGWYDNMMFTLNYVMVPLVMNIYVLPIWYKEKIIKIYQDHIIWLENENVTGQSEKIQELISRLEVNNYTDDEIDNHMIKLEQRLDMFDITGNLNWRKQIPLVYNMLEEHKRRKAN